MAFKAIKQALGFSAATSRAEFKLSRQSYDLLDTAAQLSSMAHYIGNSLENPEVPKAVSEKFAHIAYSMQRAVTDIKLNYGMDEPDTAEPLFRAIRLDKAGELVSDHMPKECVDLINKVSLLEERVEGVIANLHRYGTGKKPEDLDYALNSMSHFASSMNSMARSLIDNEEDDEDYGF